MKNLDDMTPIELNVLINKNKEKHDNLKNEIILLLGDINKIEEQINYKIDSLVESEDYYIKLMEALMKKQ